MANTGKAGATAPAEIEVRGIRFTVNEGYTASWAFFEAMRSLKDSDADVFDKLDASFEVIEAATGVTKDEIVEAVGGASAPASEVVAAVAEIIQAMTPKN